MEQDEWDHMIKIAMAGASGVGKTNMVSQYCRGDFNSESRQTIGVQMNFKTCMIDGVSLRTLLFDSAGYQRYRPIKSSYFGRALGVVIVYDVTSEHSFEELQYWIRKVHQYVPEHSQKFIFGNKTDEGTHRQVPRSKAQDLARREGMSYFEGSAKTGSKISELFFELRRSTLSVIQKFIRALQCENIDCYGCSNEAVIKADDIILLYKHLQAQRFVFINSNI